MLSTKPRLRAAAVTAIAVLAVGAPTAYATLGTDSAPSAQAAATRGKPYIGTHLYFGTGGHNGGPDVTDKQFIAFVDKTITPRFPDGLTIENARGQWKNQKGVVIRERSYELTVLYPKSESRVRDRDIEAIRTAYKRAFGQESVLRADEPASVDF